MHMLRNIFRRRLRAFLTIFGITIGVFALVVMGSMAEKINLLVDGGIRYYSDKVIITDASTAMSGFSDTPVSVGRIGEIEAVEGVAAASASVYILVDPEGGMAMGVPQGIVGSDLRGTEYEEFELTVGEGRDITADDRGKAVMGTDIAQAFGAQVGDSRDPARHALRGGGHLRQDPHRPRQHDRRQPCRRPAASLRESTRHDPGADRRGRTGYRHHRLSRAGRGSRRPRLDRAGQRGGHQGFRTGCLHRAVQERDQDLQRHHLRCGPHLLAGGRPLRGQHHDHVGARADARDRYPQGHRGLAPADRRAVSRPSQV